MSAATSIDRRAAYVRNGIPAEVSRHYREVAVHLRVAAFARLWHAIGIIVRGAFCLPLTRADELWNRTDFRQWN